MWWISYVIKKRNHIISEIKSKYWIRIHKFGLRVPRAVNEAQEIDHENDNTLWWDAVLTEMHNIRVAFETFDGEQSDTSRGY